jgi:hypothetical protein
MGAAAAEDRGNESGGAFSLKVRNRWKSSSWTFSKNSLNSISTHPENGVRRTVQVPFSGRQGPRMVFSIQTARPRSPPQGSEPYGLLRLLKRKGYLERVKKLPTAGVLTLIISSLLI